MCSSCVTSDYFYFFIFFVVSVNQGRRPTHKNSADRATFDIYFAGFFSLNFFLQIMVCKPRDIWVEI